MIHGVQGGWLYDDLTWELMGPAIVIFALISLCLTRKQSHRVAPYFVAGQVGRVYVFAKVLLQSPSDGAYRLGLSPFPYAQSIVGLHLRSPRGVTSYSPYRASEDGGGLLTRAGGRSDEICAPAIPATARVAPGTEVITPQKVRSLDKAPENTKIRNRDHALNDQNVSTMAALTVETHSGRFTATSGDTSPPRRDRPLVKAVPEEATEPITRRPPNQATERVAILRPERAVQSPPTVPSRKSTTKPTGDGKCKLREPPHASRLRAPGWGREAVMTAILPAKVTPGMAKDGSSPATTASHNGAAPTDPAVLPWDLLTPVTEAATVDERSVVSHGTHGTTRMTPASSVTSGCRPPQGEASDAIQGRVSRRRPHRLQADANRYAAAAAPVVCALKSPAVTSGFGDGRNQNGSEKRAVWGSGTVASGAHSAPGTTSARSRRRNAPAGGALTSSSAYRASPLSSTADRVGTGGSVFSSASGETNPGRQFGGGYVAAMGRRARSMARCEAARRLAAAMAADRGRPSTPISERARWGKGKESQVEVERRKLLQRRAEYAEELQKKAKVTRGEVAVARVAPCSANTDGLTPPLMFGIPLGHLVYIMIQSMKYRGVQIVRL